MKKRINRIGYEIIAYQWLLLVITIWAIYAPNHVAYFLSLALNIGLGLIGERHGIDRK